jgi:glycosyltransferase involved in cell wall biosynthesis
MSWLFVGPNLKTGIAHVMLKYASLVNGEYVVFGQKPIKEHYTNGFSFIIPYKEHIDSLVLYNCSKWMYMTVCETEPVHASYQLLEQFKTIHVPSLFSLNILKNQFPNTEWKLLRHYVPPKIPHPIEHRGYRFYTIGNIMDPRKNIKMLIESFLELRLPDAQLILKATCREDIHMTLPNVVILNGLFTEEHLDKIHDSCDCYVNCSNSEGVGMGAVEAAVHDKPVIISSYGGLKEYVRTPYTIQCTEGPVGIDDFLFEKDMVWGYPDRKQLMKYMLDVYTKKLVFMDHSYTKDLFQDVKKIISV